MVRNAHANHILDVTLAPSGIAEPLAAEAREIAAAVLRQLDVVGVLCVEFFVTRDGRLLINELAPRPHNSGHFTFDACVTSQFEQQLRAICGLALGSTELLRPAAMANLLGDLWQDGVPDWAAACRFPQVKLHLYGKEQARAGRKMGHLTALADTPEQAREMVLSAPGPGRARRPMILDAIAALPNTWPCMRAWPPPANSLAAAIWATWHPAVTRSTARASCACRAARGPGH